ncbi:hypothetical protein E2R51_11005 [Jeotgalibacillus sp. S-D1]|uniref:hypothetical protein n=1 Tax=Jeotgalibacillus sp. S-D1 TaxID=2552189 RepID=UPI001059DC7F|nr:hypothetical protein [Jeotgalibacillus sp. S-D1]TDL31750.1 hypothetical protein E2R51_11005 [Jeotgalibacillus sp. S-D1]
MTLWLVTTLGFLMFLGMAGGTFIYFFRYAMEPKDSIRVDPLIRDSDFSSDADGNAPQQLDI